MFTGIVREIGLVHAIEPLVGDGRRLTISAPATASGLEEGASISVDGACLTVVQREESRFIVDVIHTTLARTIIGGYSPSTPVNLEPAVQAAMALDGHLVQGHVDGVGEILERKQAGSALLLRIRIPEEIGRSSIPQGSMTVNGVSLTLESLTSDEECRVAIIPHTATVTTLGALGTGDRVNLEGDLIGKHVGRYLARHFKGPDAAQ